MNPKEVAIRVADLFIEQMWKIAPEADPENEKDIAGCMITAMTCYHDERIRLRDRQEATIETLTDLKKGIRRASTALTFYYKNVDAMADWMYGDEPKNATQHFANVANRIIYDLTLSVSVIEDDIEEMVPGSKERFDNERKEYAKGNTN